VDIIGRPLVTWVKHVKQRSMNKNNKKVEIQEIDEEDNAFVEDGSDSPEGGG
jgi:hypothetical protein